MYQKRVFHWASSLIASRWAVFGILCIVIFGNVSRRALYVLYEHCSRSTAWQSPHSRAMFPMLTALVATVTHPIHCSVHCPVSRGEIPPSLSVLWTFYVISRQIVFFPCEHWTELNWMWSIVFIGVANGKMLCDFVFFRNLRMAAHSKSPPVSTRPCMAACFSVWRTGPLSCCRRCRNFPCNCSSEKKRQVNSRETATPWVFFFNKTSTLNLVWKIQKKKILKDYRSNVWGKFWHVSPCFSNSMIIRCEHFSRRTSSTCPPVVISSKNSKNLPVLFLF